MIRILKVLFLFSILETNALASQYESVAEAAVNEIGFEFEWRPNFFRLDTPYECSKWESVNFQGAILEVSSDGRGFIAIDLFQLPTETIFEINFKNDYEYTNPLTFTRTDENVEHVIILASDYQGDKVSLLYILHIYDENNKLISTPMACELRPSRQNINNSRLYEYAKEYTSKKKLLD